MLVAWGPMSELQNPHRRAEDGAMAYNPRAGETGTARSLSILASHSNLFSGLQVSERSGFKQKQKQNQNRVGAGQLAQQLQRTQVRFPVCTSIVLQPLLAQVSEGIRHLPAALGTEGQ